jgi:hypothetical protein
VDRVESVTGVKETALRISGVRLGLRVSRSDRSRIIEVAMGTVKWFNPTIKADDGGADVFVHISAVEKAGYATLVGVPRLATG